MAKGADQYLEVIRQLKKLIRTQGRYIAQWDSENVEKLTPLIEEKAAIFSSWWENPEEREKLLSDEKVLMELPELLELLDNNLVMLSMAVSMHREIFKTLESGVSTYNFSGKVR